MLLLTKRALEAVANSFLKLKPLQHERMIVGGSVGAFGTLTTSNGHQNGSITVSLQEQIVDALRSGDRVKASCLLSELGHTSEALGASDFLPILKDCARLPDPLFALDTWKLMKEKEINLQGKCYFYTFRALCKAGYLEQAMSLLRDNPDCYPLLPLYNSFLSACAQTSNLTYAIDCLNLMDDQMVGKNEITYAELLKLAVLWDKRSAVHEMWMEYNKYYSVSIISLRKFVQSFTKLRDLDSAYDSLQYMVDLACRGSLKIIKTAEGKLFQSRLDISIPSNGDSSLKRCSADNRMVPSIFKCYDRTGAYSNKNECNHNDDLKSPGTCRVRTIVPAQAILRPVMKLLRWSFNDLIHACANLGNSVLAEQLMLQMEKLGLVPSSATYDGFLRAVLPERGFQIGLEVLEVMKQKSMNPYDSTLAAISVSCSRSLELGLAEAFLDQMSTCTSPYPYNALLEACDTMDQPEHAVKVLAKMKKLKVQPDIRTYELLFSLFGNVNAPYEEGNRSSQVVATKRIDAIEMAMKKNGIQHSCGSLINLLKALGTEGMINELIQRLREAEHPFSSTYSLLGTPIYNIVLHSLVEAGKTHMAAETFKIMKSCGIPSDAATYNIMIYCCSIIKCFKSALVLVSLMIRDGFAPGILTYTTLIKTLLGLDNLDAALELLNQGKLDGIRPDLLLYNTILQAACEKGRIDVLELIVGQMHQEKIQPDLSTCSYVFSAYVEGGFYNSAVEALQGLSMRMISVDDDIPEKTRTVYQNLIEAEEMETESQIMELFRDSEHHALALLNLRWCSVAGFPISWLPNESWWAKRLSKNYASQGVPG